MALDCPLCDSKHVIDFAKDKRRQYFRCSVCSLVFADPLCQLSPSQEKAVYELHENDEKDQGYRRFLNRLMQPLLERFEANVYQGLDFGCGPTPVLANMIKEQGHQMSIYDPYFAPDFNTLKRKYDFITCTEVVEHFYYPKKHWCLLLSLLKANGWLAIMTKLVIDASAFERWHYKNDPTHVSFFSRETFIFLATRDNLDVEFVGTDVILMRNKDK